MRKTVQPFAVVTLFLSAIMFINMVVLRAWWNPIDEKLVDKADAADNLASLPPHEIGIWVLINGGTVLAFLLLIAAILAVVFTRKTSNR